MAELLPRYDFDMRQDQITDEGDIVPVNLGASHDEIDNQMSAYALLAEQDQDHFVDPRLIEVEKGPSVTFNERAVAIRALAKIYSGAARARGFSKATSAPLFHKGIAKRYSDPKLAVANALENSRQALQKEDALLAPLLKTQQLKGMGFDKYDLEDDAQIIKLQLRQAIGVNVGYRARDKVVKGLYRPKEK